MQVVSSRQQQNQRQSEMLITVWIEKWRQMSCHSRTSDVTMELQKCTNALSFSFQFSSSFFCSSLVCAVFIPLSFVLPRASLFCFLVSVYIYNKGLTSKNMRKWTVKKKKICGFHRRLLSPLTFTSHVWLYRNKITWPDFRRLFGSVRWTSNSIC